MKLPLATPKMNKKFMSKRVKRYVNDCIQNIKLKINQFLRK